MGKDPSLSTRLNPTWVAILEDGSAWTGRPSWCGSSAVALPHEGQLTDWGRLKVYCEDEKKRIKRLTLFVPGYCVLAAPEGMGAYGFFEQHEIQPGRKSGCVALGICWPEDDGQGKRVIKVQLVRANGILEHWNRYKWQSCIIGDPEWKPGKELPAFRDGTVDKGN